jgi:hypothetical protein
MDSRFDSKGIVGCSRLSWKRTLDKFSCVKVSGSSMYDVIA